MAAAGIRGLQAKSELKMTTGSVIESKAILRALEQLKKALIDTSSIIYVQKAGYYDVLMMLNFLLFSQKIDDAGYRRYYSALENIARYSEPVWEYGRHVYAAIKVIPFSETLR